MMSRTTSRGVLVLKMFQSIYIYIIWEPPTNPAWVFRKKAFLKPVDHRPPDRPWVESTPTTHREENRLMKRSCGPSPSEESQYHLQRVLRTLGFCVSRAELTVRNKGCKTAVKKHGPDPIPKLIRYKIVQFSWDVLRDGTMMMRPVIHEPSAWGFILGLDHQ